MFEALKAILEITSLHWEVVLGCCSNQC